MAHVLGALKEWQWKLNQLNVPPMPRDPHGFHLKLRSRETCSVLHCFNDTLCFFWQTESIFVEKNCAAMRSGRAWLTRKKKGHRVSFPSRYEINGATYTQAHLYAWMVKYPSGYCKNLINVICNMLMCDTFHFCLTRLDRRKLHFIA